MMKAKNKPTQTVPNTLEQDVLEIESMTDEEIDRELIEVHGIDPQRAIAKVTATVRSQINKWDRGRHHEEKAVAHHTPVSHAANGKE